MVVSTPDADSLSTWFAVKIGAYLNESADCIDVDTPLADYGLDSVFTVSLCADLQSEYGFDIDTTLLWDYPTISAVAEHLSGVHADS